MTREHQLFFSPFRLDLANERLWRGEQLLPLRPKAFAVLRYLAEHAQRLVTQEELLRGVWQRPYVSESLLRGYIRELRVVLGDEARAPRFIETASRRGYRFIVQGISAIPAARSEDDPAEPNLPALPAAGPPTGGEGSAAGALAGAVADGASGRSFSSPESRDWARRPSSRYLSRSSRGTSTGCCGASASNTMG